MKNPIFYVILMASIVITGIVMGTASYFYLTKIEQHYKKVALDKDKLINEQIARLKTDSKLQLDTLKSKANNEVNKLKSNLKINSQSKNTQIIALKKAITKNKKIEQNLKTNLNKTISTLINKQLNSYLNERKKDIIFLSRVKLRQKVINSFYFTSKLNNKLIYKEVSFFNTKGKELYKKSDIEVLKMNLFKKKNTYCKKENYKKYIPSLQEGQVYISKPISCKGKNKIIRMVTPIIRNFKKVGYLQVAIDYAPIAKLKKGLGK